MKCRAEGRHASERGVHECDIGVLRAACDERLQLIVDEHPSLTTRNQARDEQRRREQTIPEIALLRDAIVKLRRAADELYKRNIEDARARTLDRTANSVVRVCDNIAAAARRDIGIPYAVEAVKDGATVAICPECDVAVELTVMIDEESFTGIEYAEHMRKRHGVSS